MKILLLIDQLSVGGAESHLITLAKTLISRGHTVHVFAERGPWTDKALAAGAVCFSPPAPLTGKAFVLSVLPNLSYLRRLVWKEGYHILHAHTRRTAYLLRLLGRRPFCARVVTCHARFSPRLRHASFWGERTIAVSEDLARHLTEAFHRPPGSIRVIPNGIDGAHFTPDGRRDDPATLRVTFASRLDEDCAAGARALLSVCKDWHTTLATHGRLLSLTIVGGGTAYPALCREAAAVNAQMGEEIAHMGGKLDDLAPVLRRTDLFVGVSRAAMEALFCGASVLLAGDEGMAGLLTEENFDRLAAGNFCCRGEEKLTRERLNDAFLAFLAESAATQKAKTARLCAMATGGFSAERMASATEEVYRSTLRAHRPKKWLIAGYAGCGNLGDDAILRRLVARLTQQDPDAKIAATVRDPADPRHRFGKVRLVERRSPVSLLRAVWQADALMMGGGCLLQNGSRHGGRSLCYYLALAHLSRLLGRPVLWIAAGAGPLEGRIARALVGRTLRRAAYLSVRDAASRRLLLSLGVPRARIRCRSDPVLSIVPAPESIAKAFLASRLPPSRCEDRFLCIAPRAGCVDEAALAQALAHLHRSDGLYPLFLAFDRAEDAPVCDRLIASCGLGVRLPAEDETRLAGLFSLPCVVGVAAGRLHALILAHVGGARGIALCGDGRDGKVAGFAASVGAVSVGASADGEELVRALRGLFNQRDE